MRLFHFRLFCCLMALALMCGCGKPKSEDKAQDRAKRPRNQYSLGDVVSFARGGPAGKYMQGGWGDIEPAMTWSNGSSAYLSFTLRGSGKPLRLRMNVAGFIKPPWLTYQPVEVYVNNEKMADWQVSERADHFAIIPPEVADHEQLMVELRIPAAVAPKTLRVNQDVRMLGVSCFELEITEATEEAAVAAEKERARRAEEVREGIYAFGTILRFGSQGGAQPYKVSGWHPPEKDFTWTDKDPGILELTIPLTDRPLLLKTRMAGMLSDRLRSQATEVRANGEIIAEWEVGIPAEFEAIIPAALAAANEKLRIEFHPAKPVSPKELQTGEDSRTFGIRCEALVITEGNAEAAPVPTPSIKPSGNTR